MFTKTRVIALGLLTMLMTECTTQPSSSTRKELVVAMDELMPGYFTLEGESYGYQYDLFKAYAQHLGVPLRIVNNLTSAQQTELLRRGEIDFVATLERKLSETEKRLSTPIYNTSYVLLSPKNKAQEARGRGIEPISTLLSQGRVLIPSELQSSRLFTQLCAEVPKSNLFISQLNSFELIELISDGAYDYLICEMSEAQLGCALMRRVEQLYTFSEPIAISTLTTPKDHALQQEFEQWYTLYKQSESYAMLNYLYFEKGIVGQFISRANSPSEAGRISIYDELFRQICEQEGYDWRFIAAIAYNESRFNPYCTSHRGAKGLMQVMPRVAEQLGYPGSLLDPEHNVLMGVKVLGRIEKSLRFKAGTPLEERQKIILACYNAGIGHVLDARNLARKYGANPDRWSDVSHYLSAKADPAIHQDEVVKCGGFNSQETLAFVDRVIKSYSTYCKKAEA